MFILLACISLVGFIASLLVYFKLQKTDHYDTTADFEFVKFIFGLALIVSVFAICVLSYIIYTANTIDNKIEMYQEENTNIEQEIDTLVKQYMNYEQEVFDNLKTEKDSITLVSLIPELNSDTLVQKQLEIYIDNNAKIMSLKEDKIGISKAKWLLYFGK